MPQRSSHPKNNAEGVSAQRSAGSDERRQLGNAGNAKPISRERIQASREAISKHHSVEDEVPLDVIEESPIAGREARFRSDLDQVAQHLRGIQFGSLLITIQDGVVVQLDRTERTRLRKPHNQTIRREPRHPDC